MEYIEEVIPLPNEKYRYIRKDRDREGNFVTTRDENYQGVERRERPEAAEEDVAAKVIRRYTGKGSETAYIKTRDNKDKENFKAKESE